MNVQELERYRAEKIAAHANLINALDVVLSHLLGAAGIDPVRQQKPSKLATAIMEAAQNMPGKFFTRGDIINTLSLENGELTTAERNNIGMTLLDLVARGQLTKTGTGSDSSYSLPAPRKTDAEKNYEAIRGEIHVPRDLPETLDGEEET